MVTGKQCQNVEHLGLAFFYPLVNIQKAIENGHRNKIVDLPLKMMIFHGYWGLPEGNLYGNFNVKLIF